VKKIDQEMSVQKTTFVIYKMDCASEEQLIRLALSDFKNISSLQFDIPNRRLEVYHSEDYAPIFQKLCSLHLDASFIETGNADEVFTTGTERVERKILWQVLAINFFFFVLEILMGLIADSMGLVADSLDMLADSLVYGLALFAVGGTTARKKNIAPASGSFHMLLALLGITEVVRRFLGFGDAPLFHTMILISLLALIGNTVCLRLLQKSKSSDAHMRASMIFTSNDIIINMGVIIAGVLVFITHSNIPDLVIGAIVFLLVARGAYRILQISR
jgi:Co/Zn/Cd efflux system component